MMRIGLLGGSFNPAHEGHRAISLEAMKRLRLDRVWWLVSPGNPLKAGAKDMADMGKVMAVLKPKLAGRADMVVGDRGVGDIALMLIESNHDLRAARILLGRLNGKMQRLTDIEADELELLAGSPSLARGDRKIGVRRREGEE